MTHKEISWLSGTLRRLSCSLNIVICSTTYSHLLDQTRINNVKSPLSLVLNSINHILPGSTFDNKVSSGIIHCSSSLISIVQRVTARCRRHELLRRALQRQLYVAVLQQLHPVRLARHNRSYRIIDSSCSSSHEDVAVLVQSNHRVLPAGEVGFHPDKWACAGHSCPHCSPARISCCDDVGALLCLYHYRVAVLPVLLQFLLHKIVVWHDVGGLPFQTVSKPQVHPAGVLRVEFLTQLHQAVLTATSQWQLRRLSDVLYRLVAGIAPFRQAYLSRGRVIFYVRAAPCQPVARRSAPAHSPVLHHRLVRAVLAVSPVCETCH